MSVTQSDLNSFHQFALARINNGGAEESFLELASQWQATREQDEVVAMIHDCIPDMERGIGTPLHEAADGIRRELGFPRPTPKALNIIAQRRGAAAHAGSVGPESHQR